MKQILYLFLSGIVLFISCNKETDLSVKEEVSVNVLEFSSECKDVIKSANLLDYRVTIQSNSENYLEIVHQGSETCCETDSIKIDYKISGDSLLIKEIDMGPYTYCYCPHDIKFKIGPLKYEKYKIVMIESESSYHRDTIRFEYNHAENSHFTVIQ